jgi:excinuclease ABC subunit B
LYADSITPSMQKAVHETKRRRKKQHAHNVAHGITPTPIVKEIKDIREESRERVASVQALATVANPAELQAAISTLEANMQQAAENLEFELAAVLRDQLSELKNQVDLPNKP